METNMRIGMPAQDGQLSAIVDLLVIAETMACEATIKAALAIGLDVHSTITCRETGDSQLGVTQFDGVRLMSGETWHPIENQEQADALRHQLSIAVFHDIATDVVTATGAFGRRCMKIDFEKGAVGRAQAERRAVLFCAALYPPKQVTATNVSTHVPIDGIDPTKDTQAPCDETELERHARNMKAIKAGTLDAFTMTTYAAHALCANYRSDGRSVVSLKTGNTFTPWHPAHDNAAAFRLAIDLDITVKDGQDATMVAEYDNNGRRMNDIEEQFDPENRDDSYRAARLAVLRAAAFYGNAALAADAQEDLVKARRNNYFWQENEIGSNRLAYTASVDSPCPEQNQERQVMHYVRVQTIWGTEDIKIMAECPEHAVKQLRAMDDDTFMQLPREQ